jgi:hypothetical protein
MNRDADPGPPSLPGTLSGADGLSPEQKEFARVLGRLLARRWHEQTREREQAPADPNTDSATPASQGTTT